jgi:hypothetical protein
MVRCHLSKWIIIIGPTATLLFPQGVGGGIGYTYN